MNKRKKQKRIIVFICMILLVIGLTSCTRCDAEYMPNGSVEEEKWRCQEVNMYFYMAYPYPYGELNIDGKTINFITTTVVGAASIGVYEDTEVARSQTAESHDYQLFSISVRKYKNGKFIGVVHNDKYNLFEGRPHELTFIREEY